ncbi:glycosyltransferase family 2 protein [Gloeobacter violaceus]|uniref:glycosyltransferase family 2 protein n=1 Tax=Gloeobacter violaceus TaxID=33072 RepID=UPI0013E8C6E6|nr:glycosyltransferase [Gloeobacter violaceus]
MKSATDAVVTVLLFARDRPHFLPHTLRSVALQTERRWRLVLSDNSSDPACARANAEMTRQFAAAHPHHEVAYVRRSGKLTVMGHFQAALQEVETPFVAVHNDDDIWMPHHLEQALAWLEGGEDRGMTASDAVIIDVDGHEKGQFLNWVLAPREDAWWQWIAIWLSTYPSHYGNWPGFVLRTPLIRQLPHIDNKLTDAAAIIWCALQGYRIKGFDVPSYYYRIHNLSVTKTGTHLLIEKHRLILWLAKHHFLRLTRLYGPFPLLTLKAALALRLKYKRALA